MNVLGFAVFDELADLARSLTSLKRPNTSMALVTTINKEWLSIQKAYGGYTFARAARPFTSAPRLRLPIDEKRRAREGSRGRPGVQRLRGRLRRRRGPDCGREG